MSLNRTLFKRQINGNRWDARIYDYFLQRRFGPFKGNAKPSEPAEAAGAGEVVAPGKGPAHGSSNESLGVSNYTAYLFPSKWPASISPVTIIPIFRNTKPCFPLLLVHVLHRHSRYSTLLRRLQILHHTLISHRFRRHATVSHAPNRQLSGMARGVRAT